MHCIVFLKPNKCDECISFLHKTFVMLIVFNTFKPAFFHLFLSAFSLPLQRCFYDIFCHQCNKRHIACILVGSNVHHMRPC